MIQALLRKVLKRMHYPLEVMLVWVRWYAAYPLSLRHIEEMMVERGVFVDHATIHRWSIRILPLLATVFRRRKRPCSDAFLHGPTSFSVIGTIGTLTPVSVHLTGRSPRLSRATFLSFHPQPRDTPQHRFIRHHQRAVLFPGFATLVQARRNIPPKQVRHPTDRQFVSSCSPPRLATTQLLSTTELWRTPTGICTLLIARLHGRTLNR